MQSNQTANGTHVQQLNYERRAFTLACIYSIERFWSPEISDLVRLCIFMPAVNIGVSTPARSSSRSEKKRF
jgi:hypothetical protein